MYLRGDMNVDFLITEGESHITRARNNIAATFLKETEYDHLAFIDADIELNSDDFYRLAQMDGVRGAAVACKTPDFSERLSIYVDGGVPRRAHMPREPFPVDFLGSAVLFISRKVLEHLRASEAVSQYHDPIIGRAWDFFRDGVIDDFWASEDYGFCKLLRDHDIEIVCDPAIRVKHYGSTFWSH